MAQGDNIGIPISTSTTFAENSDAIAPSQKAVKTVTDGKQATLISGTNIKTINTNTLLGSGDLTITGITVEQEDMLELSYLRSLYNLIYR